MRLRTASVVAEKPTVTAGEDLFTRAELVSALHQKAGSPVVNFAMQYTDVEQGAEYAEAIRWGVQRKNRRRLRRRKVWSRGPVTREQMALILYRYAQNNDQGFTGAWAFPLNYSDASQISEYAYEAICWVTMKDVRERKRSSLCSAGYSYPAGGRYHADPVLYRAGAGRCAIKELKFPGPHGVNLCGPAV